jgi:exonuclease VII small subunit
VTKLDELTSELEQIADRLREGNLEPDEAADLVEQCARLAAAAASELDQAARDTR